MSQRAFWIVAVLAAISLTLAVLANRNPDTGTNGPESFLPELQAVLGEVDRVEIRTGGNETVATLRRAEDGWVVEQKDGYAADVSRIRSALTDLAETSTLEDKTANPALHDRLGVEDISLESATGIGVTAAVGDDAVASVVLGDAVGSAYRYARRVGEDQSYLIDRNPELPRDVGQWLMTDIMDVRGTRVQQVTIEHADGEHVVISKDDPSQTNFTVADVPEGRELQYPGVANVIGNALRELKLEDVAREVDARDDEPDVTVEFRTFDGLVVLAKARSIDDQGWLSFEPRFDAEQAARFSQQASNVEGQPAAEADRPDSAPEAGEPDTASASTGASDAVQAEARAMEQRVSGWRYRIPSYQYDQITRRLADLLQAQ